MNWTASIVTLFVSFISAILLGALFIPMLINFKTTQTILNIGPKWHKAKGSIPTMGGIFLILSALIGLVAAAISTPFNSNNILSLNNDSIKLIAGFGCAFGCGLIGFLDDFLKIIRKNNYGLTPLQKTTFQFIVLISYFLTLILTKNISTIVSLPFFGHVDFGIWYHIIAIFGSYGFTNAVNLSDGIDGLASSLTAIYCMFFVVTSSILCLPNTCILASAICGCCLGFLVWNFNPAKVFMGDTGSLFLGGSVIALGFGCNQPILIIIFGLVYIIEAMSVVIQVANYKLTGKRIFKMSPIHHHFELCGWSEIKIVLVFSTISLIAGCLGLLYLRLV